jgi:YegS/Rv2252/BmrU family lipid kinase
MQENALLKYLFIINPGSGSKNADGWKTVIGDFFKERNVSYDIYLLSEKFDLKEIRNKIATVKPENVIAVGGDGTVTMLANILAGKDIPLGILPGGSANGMAKELGIPQDPKDALQTIDSGFTKTLDLIKINDDLCLHMSDLGLNARLIKYFEEGKLRGKWGYGKVILRTLWHREKMFVTIRTGEGEVKRVAYMVVLANARMYGTGAVINPEGKPDDGLFEVIIIRKLSFIALLKMLFRPGIFNPKHIEILHCTSAEISTTKNIHFQVDGEYLGKVNKVRAVIQPGIIKMILPGS